MAVKVEYLLADYIGRAQRRLYRRRWADLERRAEACRVIGRGGILHGRELQDAQQFAAAMWFRAGVTSLAVFAVVGVAVGLQSKAIRHDVSGVLLAPLVLMVVCLMQIIPITWRRNWTTASANRRNLGLPVNQREERRGQPRVRDFWIMVAIAIALVWVIFYGSSHWSH